RLGIVVEEPEDVHETRAGDRIAADPDARGLADPPRRELADNLVGQGAAPRHDADGAGRVDVAGHDADLRLVRRDDAGAVRADQPAPRPRGAVLRADPVGDRGPLGDADARGLVDQDAQRDPFASATTLRAPSPMSVAVTNRSPDSASIRLPSSTFVPSIRTTTGRRRPSFLAAAIRPSARRSTRRMPPKTLMKTAFTLGSDERMRNAFSICSGEAPPPTSRKFARSPRDSLMISICPVGRPARLTIQ